MLNKAKYIITRSHSALVRPKSRNSGVNLRIEEVTKNELYRINYSVF